MELFHVKHLNDSTKKRIRVIEFLLGLTMTFVFLCNIGMRYSNIGSLTGVIVHSLLLAHSLNPEWFQSIAEKLKQSRAGRIVWKGLCITVGGILLLAVLTTGCMIAGIPEAPDDLERTVIILGSGVNEDGTPTTVMKSRIDAAMDYIQTHPQAPIIASGGLYSTDRIAEAESICRYLIENGIPEQRIYTERDSSSTEENLRNSAALIQANGLSTNIVLSTSEFHSYRAGLIARRNQLNTRAIPARTPWYILPTCWIREMYGILLAWTQQRG